MTAADVMVEPSGLWAVVEYVEADTLTHLVKAPGGFVAGTAYWFAIGTEDGWSWDQVMRWPGTVRVVRDGVTS